MDASAVIAIAGLTTALLGTLTVPLLQSFFTNKRENALRLDERQHSAYIDAVTYAQIVAQRLEDLSEDPLTRSHRALRPTPDEVLIRAKLDLVAPTAVTQAFDELTRSWEILSWNLNEEGPSAVYGDEVVFHVAHDSPDVIRVVTAINRLKQELRPKKLGELPVQSPRALE
ncbi:hypothetical protein [Mycobacterium sp. C31M]